MDSLPPPPLRLLPAGTTSCRVGITPTEISKPYTTHAPAGAKGFSIYIFRPCRGSSGFCFNRGLRFACPRLPSDAAPRLHCYFA
jgi:hypothetical protein